MSQLFMIISLILFISKILGLDIELSLGQKINSKYPVILTMKDDFQENIDNRIDLICIYDYFINDKLKLLETLSLIYDCLKNNDSLSLIEFRERADIILKKEIINNNKNDILNKINITLAPYSPMYIDYEDPLKKLVEILSEQNNNSPDNKIVQTVFFINYQCQSSQDLADILKNLLGKNNLDFSLYFFSLGLGNECKSNQNEFINLSDSRDGAFYAFNNDDDLQEYFIDIINDLRRVNYKVMNISINSNYPITQFYGGSHKNVSFNKENGKSKAFSFSQLQLISNKEYNFVLEVELDDDIKIGDRILYANIEYTYLGSKNNSLNILKYYNAINYFFYNKGEYCKARLIDACEIYLINYFKELPQLRKPKFDERIKLFKEFCGAQFNEKIYENIIDEKKLFIEKINLLREYFILVKK